MKKRIALRALAMGMMALIGGSALTSCSNDDEPQVAYKEGQQGYVEFTLTRGADTRTGYEVNSEGGLDLTWSENDQVVVFYQAGTDEEIVEVFDITEGAGEPTAKFAKSDSQLADKAGDLSIMYRPGYDIDRGVSDNIFDFSEQDGTLQDLGSHDTFTFKATLDSGKIKVEGEGYFVPAMTILHFPTGLDFGTAVTSSDLVLSGGANKQPLAEGKTGDITVKGVSLTDGKLSQDLYVAVYSDNLPTSFSIGNRYFSLPKGFNPGKVYTLKQEYLNEIVPLTIEALADGTITIKNPRGLVISYVKNGEPKETSEEGNTEDIKISVSAGDKVQFFGNNNRYSDEMDSSNSTRIRCLAKSKVYGNIMSLISEAGYHELTELTDEFTFSYLFNYSKLTDASGLILPAETLAPHCYFYMFNGCTALEAAPELPATTLADWCYSNMFYGCTSLTAAPELKATNLAWGCYSSMFNGCTALVTAPELKATTLEYGCYNGMFWDCTALVTAPKLPAENLADACYGAMFYGCTALINAPELPAKALAVGCYGSMFHDCTALVNAPKLPAENLADHCYQSMFHDCTALVNAPELPAENLQYYCYAGMFYGCTALEKAPTELPAENLAGSCYSNMFQGCTALVNAPELPATTLAVDCYYGMFYGCTALEKAPTELPAENLQYYCYSNMFNGCTALVNAPKLPATTLAQSCYARMFEGCTSLVTAPELPATTLATYCYSSMFLGCTALTTAPELPAETLAPYCYSHMFEGCPILTSVTCLATDISATDCTDNWLNGVAASGTFTKAAKMADGQSWTEDSVSGIPSDWTIKDKEG